MSFHFYVCCLLSVLAALSIFCMFRFNPLLLCHTRRSGANSDLSSKIDRQENVKKGQEAIKDFHLMAGSLNGWCEQCSGHSL